MSWKIYPRELAPAASAFPEEPFYNPEELLGIIPEDNRTPVDVREIIARMVDDRDSTNSNQGMEPHWYVVLHTSMATK